MNTMILGLPRNGKGLYSMKMLIDEMVIGKRCVVTNLAVEKMPWETSRHELRRGLVSYLNEKHDSDCNCVERIFRISDNAIKNFYLYRSLSRSQIKKLGERHLVGYRAVTLADDVLDEREFYLHKEFTLFVADHVLETDKKGRCIVSSFNSTLAGVSGGQLNCADECWKFWPARSWQSTSDADVFYNAQHGKFGDDNLFVTHRHNDIDSVIVDRCQECIVLTHNGKMNWGKFRRNDNYTAATYSGRPTPSKEPMSTMTFTLDKKGLGATYDTSAGVGVSGRGAADIGGRKKKGLPMWTMPVFVLAGIAVLIYGLKFGAVHLVGMFTHKPAAVGKSGNPAKRTETSHGETMAVNKGDAASPAIDATGSLTNPLVICTGYVLFPTGVKVFFSDGSTYDENTGVQIVSPDSVVVNGKRWPVTRGKVGGEAQYQDYVDSDKVWLIPEHGYAETGASVTLIGSPRLQTPRAAFHFGSASMTPVTSPATYGAKTSATPLR